MNDSEIPKRKPTNKTVFPIASVSKVLTVRKIIEAASCVLNLISYISHAGWPDWLRSQKKSHTPEQLIQHAQFRTKLHAQS